MPKGTRHEQGTPGEQQATQPRFGRSPCHLLREQKRRVGGDHGHQQKDDVEGRDDSQHPKEREGKDVLDGGVVDYINRLPYYQKVKGAKTKLILKKAMAKHLPAEIINRPKKGFGVPLGRWFGHELKDFMLDSLSPESVDQCQIFNYSYIEKIISDHLHRRQDNRLAIWSVLSFVQWYKNWV